MLKIQINTDGAAFKDEYENGNDDIYEVSELRRILKRIIEAMEAGEKKGVCIDMNGNKVGEWKR